MRTNTFFEMKATVLEQAFLDLLEVVAAVNPRAEAGCKAILYKMKSSHDEICKIHGIEFDEQTTSVSEGEGMSGEDSGGVQLGQPDNDSGAS